MVNKTTPNPQGSFSCWWSSRCIRWWRRGSQQRWGSTGAPGGWTRRRSGSPDTAAHTHTLLQGCQVNQGTQKSWQASNEYLIMHWRICVNRRANTIQHTWNILSVQGVLTYIIYILTLVMLGGLMCPSFFYLFFYLKSLPQTKPLDPPVNS